MGVPSGKAGRPRIMPHPGYAAADNSIPARDATSSSPGYRLVAMESPTSSTRGARTGADAPAADAVAPRLMGPARAPREEGRRGGAPTGAPGIARAAAR